MVVELDDNMKEQVQEMFDFLINDVTAHLFVADHQCLYCNDTKALIEQVAELSDKITVVEHKGPSKRQGESPAAASLESTDEFGVRFTPAIVVHGLEKYKVRFYGIPAGHEFGALIGTIVDASTGTPSLPPDIAEDIQAMDKPIHIQVFTTPQCVYCPTMVRLAHSASILNPLIQSDMIESLEFQELAAKYEVFGVPKTILNETIILDGMAPPELFVEKLYDAVEK
jgi:glutaredoxin-like protein